MKKNKLFSLGLAVVVMGFGSNALADDATGVFQWKGAIPPSNTGVDTRIVNTGTVPHLNGTMTFAASAAPGEYEVLGSSELTFGVEESGAAAASFDYEIQSLKFSAGGGVLAEVSASPEFTVKANGTSLVKGTPVTGASGNVNLTVSNDSPIDFAQANDDVVVQATILVTNGA
ncbi:conserved exported hypothetical protein [Vibrio crassostreae]|uniref:hypothetical protein n=1 Tax=Vibrio crassostreae TaxID=246167 RepID=UPI0010438F66|nr:hypothetical protein [Vibrio crassostreae]TCT54907.1 hypothetical protein EDB44_1397 [Vibrio crassostreae]TCT74933.1 hypothetical protein EDB43_1397 [Vibrio crassostreae]TCT95097.1 hypothetical protein EDB47_1471 [Vibrio crassostreae]CAK2125447.1 conserved exported hypothetical protein [Vibrio crassostreae]CAK2126761.1 conserved exported hypothetical protein [Vibrio crassostreae]